MEELEIRIEAGEIMPVAILPTTTDEPVVNGKCRLHGWSLRDAAGEVAQNLEGSVVAPAANTNIVTSATIPAGNYNIGWTVELLGPAAVADANNFQIVIWFHAGIPSLNPGAAGVYPQEGFQQFFGASATVLINSIGAGTAGVTYAAQLTIQPVPVDAAVAELRNGAQPLGEISCGDYEANTAWFGEKGIYTENGINLHMIQGTLTGAVYASYDTV